MDEKSSGRREPGNANMVLTNANLKVSFPSPPTPSPQAGEGRYTLNSYPLALGTEGGVRRRVRGSLREGVAQGSVGRGQGSSDRATRFPIHIPVRYRIPRSPTWFVARTENVSRSGILFRADRVFEPATALDLRLELPRVKSTDRIRGELVCKGKVVRVEDTDQLGVSPAIAVAISNYRLARRGAPN